MKIIFMGTSKFASDVLEGLCSGGHDVVLAVTKPDKRYGRGLKRLASPTGNVAARMGLKIIKPKTIDDAADEILATPCDVIVVAAYGQILPESILDYPKYGCLNVHTSLLPRYRGAAPVQWAIINGEREAGISIMRMDKGLDTGDVAASKSILIEENDNSYRLFIKLTQIAIDLMLSVLDGLEKGTITYTPQPKRSPTPYARMIDKSMSIVNWNDTANHIWRCMKALDCVSTVLEGKRLKIWRATPDYTVKEGKPGEVIRADEKGIIVRCGEGSLCIRELQLEGKKRMITDAFLRGYKLEPGTCMQ